MKELVYADAHKLFRQCAFGGDHPGASHTELTDKAIKYAQGVPLALKVLGCHLCGRSKEVWESAMRKLEIIPHEEIQEVLKISYDSLDDSQKNVFLDIAFFLEGEHRDVVISFFDASGFEAKIELSVLEYFLHRIRMHDLLRDMGREIVRKESIDYPGNRSRLWHHKDISEVLKKGQNFINLEKIDLSGSEQLMKLPDLSLARNLKILKLCGCSSLMETHSSIQCLNKLEVLDLEDCKSLTSLPNSIHSKYLKEFKISGCSNLKNFPDISSSRIPFLDLKEVGIKELSSSIECLSELTELQIDNCSRLEKISNSIFNLKSLSGIEICNCSNLKGFSDFPFCTIDETRIERVSSSTLRLKSLSSLQIIDCKKLERLPDELGNLEALRVLKVEGAAIREVPESLSQLAFLSELKLKNCSELEYISSNIFKLKSFIYIEISNCSNLKSFPKIPSCNIDGSTGIERPSSSTLRSENCSSLVSLSSSLCMLKSLSSLQIIDCKKLERLPESLVKGTAIREVPESLGQLSSLVRNRLKLDLIGLTETVYDGLRKLSFHGQSWIKSMYFPGNEIPKWFRHQSAGSTITLKMPQPPSASYNKLMGFAFCAVVAFPVSDCFRHESVEDDWKCNLLNVFCDWKFKSKGFLYPHFLGQISPVESDHVFLGSYPFDREYSYANYDEFSFHIKGSYGQHRECCEVPSLHSHVLYKSSLFCKCYTAFFTRQAGPGTSNDRLQSSFCWARDRGTILYFAGLIVLCHKATYQACFKNGLQNYSRFSASFIIGPKDYSRVGGSETAGAVSTTRKGGLYVRYFAVTYTALQKLYNSISGATEGLL
ncbi:hypothetical protein CUMW_255130 [Citrus unshiu]|uniref:NB-ARC domain-containing protein n=1 Tax=Citrus unshiu TaxID=55188 RepID=A0A2H5QRL1_CITUN|nr:hypothetical protein CUMW_255130 [Citrus unshiu]